ncbi:hypothetical protein EDC01DRAFT_631227 [Geopyxis carbonaria]|nr:hypothetical protein EDC01DRAFT_631227 [Geopyxis carbonaria]
MPQPATIQLTSLVLTTLNILAAICTIAVIFIDAHTRSRTARTGIGVAAGWHIPPKDLYPLIFSFAVAVQSLLLAIAVAGGDFSELGWTALWIAPYTTLLFALDSAQRAIRRHPFPPRTSLNLPIGLLMLILMITGTWIAVHVLGATPSAVAAAAVAILATLAPLLLFALIVAFLRLQTNCTQDPLTPERVAANREVWFGALGLTLWVLMFPAWVRAAAHIDGDEGHDDACSFVAVAAVGGEGVLTLLLHLVFRAQKNPQPATRTTVTAINARDLEEKALPSPPQPPPPANSIRSSRLAAPLSVHSAASRFEFATPPPPPPSLYALAAEPLTPLTPLSPRPQTLTATGSGSGRTSLASYYFAERSSMRPQLDWEAEEEREREERDREEQELEKGRMWPTPWTAGEAEGRKSCQSDGESFKEMRPGAGSGSGSRGGSGRMRWG